MAEDQLARARRLLDPYRPSLAQAATAVRTAQERSWDTYNRSLRLKGRRRRAAVRDHRDAQRDLTAANQGEVEAQAVAVTALQAVDASIRRVHELQQSITAAEVGQQWDQSPQHALHLRTIRRAVDEWATGQPVTTAIASMIDTLASGEAELTALAAALEHWATANGIDLGPQQPVSRAMPELTVELGW